jgi:hypothetical protein
MAFKKVEPYLEEHTSYLHDKDIKGKIASCYQKKTNPVSKICGRNDTLFKVKYL